VYLDFIRAALYSYARANALGLSAGQKSTFLPVVVLGKHVSRKGKIRFDSIHKIHRKQARYSLDVDDLIKTGGGIPFKERNETNETYLAG
jgi:hypothetical protein